MRIGIGYDVHAFAKNRKLVIGGVQVPYAEGLCGHSDADVLIHAVMDSLLGAMGLGDIGAMFPDNDIRYKDADSRFLLGIVVKLMKSKRYKLVNLDSVIIAQNPKMSPYIEKMKKNLSCDLETNVSNINIKATTTEHLGFEGKGEGIAAQAACLLENKEKQ
jgi:2-C-methyl-D-erythritol 2,4-cyclodiphosphate synthase